MEDRQLSYEYPAIRYWQLPGAQNKSIICFAAPCDEILAWAGIPRKSEAVIEEKNNSQTIELHGYQRERDKRRIDKLVEFYQAPENVIPTSVLLANRFESQVSFEPSSDLKDFGSVKVEYGTLVIKREVLDSAPLGKLYQKLANLLLQRHSSLKDEDISEETIENLKNKLITENPEIGNLDDEDGESDANSYFNEENDDDDDDKEAINPYNPDNHLVDFYREIRIRQKLCESIDALNDSNEVLGLTREMVLDYLAPITVVDGQHRLMGAQQALEYEADNYLKTEEAKNELAERSAEEITQSFRRNQRRVFSANLILDSNWSEHVFQFVVVNQKAKPISKALLSSIIGTSLSSDEIDNIQFRLEKAGIEIDDYRVMARLIEDDRSPFKNLVKKGYFAEKNKKTEKLKLDWSVLNSLAKDFRELKNLQPYDKRDAPGEVNSYKEWKNDLLLNSSLIDKLQHSTNFSGFEIWMHPTEGIWLDVFLLFWNIVKENLSDDNNDLSAWKDPNRSNLFNGATLRSLLSDFGEFLYDKEFSPDEMEDFEEIINEYIKKMNPNFFARQWEGLVGKRMDRKNLITVSTYLRNHRKTGKVDGKWKIYTR